MLRSVLAGLLSGTAVAALVLAGVSLMLPPPSRMQAGTPAEAEAERVAEAESVAEAAPVAAPDAVTAEAPAAAPAEETPGQATAATEQVPETAVVDVPAGSEFTRPKPEEDAVLPAPEPEAPPASSPTVAAPATEDAPDLTGMVPADAPVAAEAPKSPATPEPAGATTDVTLAPAPQEPAQAAEAPALSPELPAEEAVAAASTEAPAAPVMPAAAEPEAPADVTEAAPATPAPEPEQQEVATPAPAPAQEPVADEVPAAEEPPPGTMQDAGVAAEVDTGDSALPPVIQTDAPEPPQGVTRAPTPGFKRVVPGVKVNRLPTIGAGDGGGGDAEVLADDGANQDEIFEGDSTLIEPAPEPDASVVVPAAPEEPAIVRFAAPFENVAKKPLLGIVLFDIGTAAGGLDLETLRTLALPLTVVVDPASPDAAARGRALRAAGFEVAILSDVPAGSTASDAEVALEGAQAILPEAVAIVGAPGATMQTDGQVAGHVVALASADGLGVVTFAGGLNPMPRLAQAAAVPHAEIWRAADGEAAGAEAIRRTLDRAAFEAAQTGAVVVSLDSRPESVTALFAWAAEVPESVAVAPVSAVALATTAP